MVFDGRGSGTVRALIPVDDEDEWLDVLRDDVMKAPFKATEWRWHTLYHTATHVEKIAYVAQFWSKESFSNAKDTATVAMVDVAMKRPKFWQEVDFISRVTWRLHKFMRWCQSCDCHEEERIQRAMLPLPPACSFCLWSRVGDLR
jgi:hypothetical protein